MITCESQLTPGRELWHIYGHLDRRADRIQVLGPVQEKITDNATYRYVEVMYGVGGAFPYRGSCYLGDVGIGANYNRNRLFDSEQEALEFWDSEDCALYRARHPRFDDQDDDFWPDDFR